MSQSTRAIWKSVVFAGAMLGAGACGKSKPAATTPAPQAAPTDGTTPTAGTATDDGTTPTDGTATANPCDGADTDEDPCADPCAGRIRGGGSPGGVGRGFVLA